jgi:hypothetical protein
MRRNWVLLLVLFTTALTGQVTDASFFESTIRPVLVAKCYACHSSKLASPMGGLTLDSRAGVLKGGALGPAIVPGRPAESRLLKAIRYGDPRLQMPPGGKLADSVIADFEQWIAAGAHDPVASQCRKPHAPGIECGQGRSGGPFSRSSNNQPPARYHRRKTKIDAFVSPDSANGLKPSDRPIEER